MIKKTGFILILILFSLLVSPKITYAKRILPQVASSLNSGNTVTKRTQGVTVSAKFRSDRNAIVATFTNLKIAKEISYTFSYKNADDIEQVAQSSVDPKEKEPVTRELLFGTCSTDNVCRYDTGVYDAKFVVTTTLLTGKKVIKTFTIKIKK